MIDGESTAAVLGSTKETLTTILGDSAEFGLGCVAWLWSITEVKSMLKAMAHHSNRLATLLHGSKGWRTSRCVKKIIGRHR
jgi:hypothetical protein